MSASAGVAAPTLSWVRDGSSLLLKALDGLTDDDLAAPSALPTWSRRQVLAHIAANAEAVGRLLDWARTGVESRMYATPEQRTHDIEVGAALPAAELRGWVIRTIQGFDQAVTELPAPAWSVLVLTAQGRTVAAADVPWMRAREVCIHALDLQTGLGFADLPAGFCSRLVADISAWRSSRGDGPALLLTATDAPASWSVDGHGNPVRVALPTADLAGWLTGRISRPDAPALPPWL